MKNSALLAGVFILALGVGAAVTLWPSKSQAPADPHADLIVIDSPKPGDVVSSTTITVTGKARGSWYFEASFPVEIANMGGSTMVSGHAEARGDWMTTEFVPFVATLELPYKPRAGFEMDIILHKDNPSGDPARDDSVTIPVTFR